MDGHYRGEMVGLGVTCAELTFDRVRGRGRRRHHVSGVCDAAATNDKTKQQQQQQQQQREQGARWKCGAGSECHFAETGTVVGGGLIGRVM